MAKYSMICMLDAAKNDEPEKEEEAKEDESRLPSFSDKFSNLHKL